MGMQFEGHRSEPKFGRESEDGNTAERLGVTDKGGEIPSDEARESRFRFSDEERARKRVEIRDTQPDVDDAEIERMIDAEEERIRRNQDQGRAAA